MPLLPRHGLRLMEALAVRLHAAAQRWQGQPVSLRRIASLHGRSAQGALLVLLAIPCLLPLPGAGTVLSFGIAAMAWMMWHGRARLVLPWRVARLCLPAGAAARTLQALAWLYAGASRLSRERWHALLHPGQRRWMAALVALMALLIFLPIPFGNVLPALALLALGVGLMCRDGLVVALAVGLGAASVGVLALLGVLAIDFGARLLQAAGL